MALFTSPIFTEGVLPFLLVFVLVFAILQKTKILGEGKTQIDALIALAIGLITIAVPTTRDFIVNMMPWLAFALVVLLVFLLVYGFVAVDSKNKDFEVPGWVKKTVLILGIIMVVVLAIYVTGFWPTVKSWFSGDDVLSSVILIIVIAVVVGMVAKNPSSGSSGGSK